MVRSKLAAIALVAALFTTGLSAQIFLQEDFSTAVGLVPPQGWSSIAYLETATSVPTPPNTYVPAPFRFDNLPGRVWDSGFTAPVACADPDGAAAWSSLYGQYVSILRAPSFDASGTTLLNLSFQTSFHALQSTTPFPDYAQTEIFDGLVWNVIDNYTVSVGYGQPNTDTTVLKKYDITAATGGSTVAQLRFNYRYGYDYWWAIDNILIEQPAPNNLAISIDSPLDDPNGCIALAGNQSVVVTVKNVGSGQFIAGTLIQVDYDLNAGGMVTEFFNLANTLGPNQSEQYTFATPANFIGGSANSLVVNVVNAGDPDLLDNTASLNYQPSFGLPLVSLPFAENFDGSLAQNSTVAPTGWIQDQNDGGGTTTADRDWYMHYGGTSSSNTGPLADTSGLTTIGHYYAYVEDSSGNHPAVNLLTPCLDLTATTAPVLQFYYFSFNGNPSGPNTQENFLSVDVLTYPGGAVTMDVFGPTGDLGYATQATALWTPQIVNLSAFAGQVATIRFRGRSDNGGSNTFYHDFAIDDVSVIDPQPTPGQAPRTGLAAFDINSSLNVNAAPVASGFGGPYFANVTQGGAMTMSFDGEPGQAIAVLYGQLNPVSATFPGGIGQFDIGGPGVNGQGIPVGIGVFVDAISWAQGGFIGLPIDAMFFTTSTGLMDITFTFPNFGIPMGAVLTSFQAAITSSAAPFVYLSNAVQVTIG
ncbi:MAG: hypothetical protein H6807_00395 [Planctomycetes bacterium]|nr:hypothetical protein [Planctomycetota bacterium]